MALLTWVLGAAPFLAMITVRLLDVGLVIVSKAAMTKGLSNFVLIVYSNSLAVIVLLPFTILRRKGESISLSLISRIFLLSLIESAVQICGFTGIKYSSPTLSSAIGTLTPLIAYFLAIMMRMEKLDLRSSAGLAVSFGAVVSVLGALIATLYQGPPILMSSYRYDFHDLHSQQSNWAFGGLLSAATSVLIAIWYIFLTGLVVEFPEKETIVLITSFLCTIITGIFSLYMETNPNAWKLTAGIEIIAILYMAIASEVISAVIRAWCLKEKGVTYTVMFQPLGIVFSVVMAVVFLGETLRTGSLVGGIVVTLGFYTVMWGKTKEQGMTFNYGVDVPESCSVEAPLLLNNNHDDEVHANPTTKIMTYTDGQ